MSKHIRILTSLVAVILGCHSIPAISKPSVTLDVNLVGDGVVTSTPSGINCPGQCSAQFTKGVIVTLTASGHGDYEFSAWSSSCTGTENTCEIRLLKPATVTATFTLGNLLPLAEDDTYTTNMNVSVTGNVMDNDYQGNAPAWVTFYDNPSVRSGSVVIAADGEFSYSPPLDFVGNDLVHYTITDANGDTSDAAAEFRINNIPEPPPTPPAPVAQTGQVLCYDIAGVEIPCAGTGQDGDSNKGIAWPIPRFVINGDGTVTDELTGLVWLKRIDCFYEYGSNLPIDWSESLNFIAALEGGQCGLTDGSTAGDWRLPNAREYLSLVDYQFYLPAVSNTMGTGQLENGDPFICESCVPDSLIQLGFYWSSTTSLFDTSRACIFRFAEGRVDCNAVKTLKNTLAAGAWAVRDP